MALSGEVVKGWDGGGRQEAERVFKNFYSQNGVNDKHARRSWLTSTDLVSL